MNIISNYFYRLLKRWYYSCIESIVLRLNWVHALSLFILYFASICYQRNLLPLHNAWLGGALWSIHRMIFSLFFCYSQYLMNTCWIICKISLLILRFRNIFNEAEYMSAISANFMLNFITSGQTQDDWCISSDTILAPVTSNVFISGRQVFPLLLR